MALVLSRQRITRWAARNESWLPNFSEKVVLFIITMQIIFTLKSNHTSIGGAPMAQPYARFVELTSVVNALLDNPERKFSEVEMKFFSMWFDEQTEEK